MRLIEKYRPRTWSEVVGQAEALNAIDMLRPRGLGGRAYWISGPPGVGKTTIARLLAAEMADPLFVREMDAGELGAPAVREIAYEVHLMAWGRGGRAFIVNEAHSLRADVLRSLLTILEDLPEHVATIFTTTTAGEAELFSRSADWQAFLSRCVDLRLNHEPPGAVELVRRIADREGLGGAPEERWRLLADESRWNIRLMLQQVDSGRMAGRADHFREPANMVREREDVLYV